MSTILAVCRASLLRHRRSRGLWIFVVAGLTCSRFLVPREHGFAVTVAVDEHLPILSSAVIGTCLSIVLTTVLLPLLFILLRANSTRLQPWQVVEVSPASRISLALGTFLADAVVLTTLLLGFTFAAWIEMWANLGWSASHLLQAAYPLWLGAFPALIGLAALRTLCAAFRLTRRAIGEVLFLIFWVASMSVPTAATRVHGRFAMYMTDFSGMIQPLRLFGSSLHRIEIGFGMPTLPGRVPFDVLGVLGTKAYLISRLCWIALSLALVVIAGALYQPHRASRHKLHPGQAPRPQLPANPQPFVPLLLAPRAPYPQLSLIRTQFSLLCRGRQYRAFSLAAALLGPFVDFRRVLVPLVLLIITFGATAWASASETGSLASLGDLTGVSPAVRFGATILSGTLWSVLMILPALIRQPLTPHLLIGLYIGAGVVAVALSITRVSKSAFAARLCLLLIWYGVLSTPQ